MVVCYYAATGAKLGTFHEKALALLAILFAIIVLSGIYVYTQTRPEYLRDSRYRCRSSPNIKIFFF